MKEHPMDTLLNKIETLFTPEEREELRRLMAISAPLLMDECELDGQPGNEIESVLPAIAPGMVLRWDFRDFWKN